MASLNDRPNFLGRGFGFPPKFSGGQVAMVEDEVDIHESLSILFGTLPGERVLQPQFGLDVTPLLFEPLSTTLRTLLKDRITTTVLIHEPRIKVLDLVIDDAQALEGILQIRLEYSVRSTNSRYNLVYPFYVGDANELRERVAPGA